MIISATIIHLEAHIKHLQDVMQKVAKLDHTIIVNILKYGQLRICLARHSQVEWFRKRIESRRMAAIIEAREGPNR